MQAVLKPMFQQTLAWFAPSVEPEYIAKWLEAGGQVVSQAIPADAEQRKYLWLRFSRGDDPITLELQQLQLIPGNQKLQLYRPELIDECIMEQTTNLPIWRFLLPNGLRDTAATAVAGSGMTPLLQPDIPIRSAQELQHEPTDEALQQQQEQQQQQQQQQPQQQPISRKTFTSTSTGMSSSSSISEPPVIKRGRGRPPKNPPSSVVAATVEPPAAARQSVEEKLRDAALLNPAMDPTSRAFDSFLYESKVKEWKAEEAKLSKRKPGRPRIHPLPGQQQQQQQQRQQQQPQQQQHEVKEGTRTPSRRTRSAPPAEEDDEDSDAIEAYLYPESAEKKKREKRQGRPSLDAASTRTSKSSSSADSSGVIEQKLTGFTRKVASAFDEDAQEVVDVPLRKRLHAMHASAPPSAAMHSFPTLPSSGTTMTSSPPPTTPATTTTTTSTTMITTTTIATALSPSPSPSHPSSPPDSIAPPAKQPRARVALSAAAFKSVPARAVVEKVIAAKDSMARQTNQPLPARAPSLLSTTSTATSTAPSTASTSSASSASSETPAARPVPPLLSHEHEGFTSSQASQGSHGSDSLPSSMSQSQLPHPRFFFSSAGFAASAMRSAANAAVTTPTTTTTTTSTPVLSSITTPAMPPLLASSLQRLQDRAFTGGPSPSFLARFGLGAPPVSAAQQPHRPQPLPTGLTPSQETDTVKWLADELRRGGVLPH